MENLGIVVVSLLFLSCPVLMTAGVYFARRGGFKYENVLQDENGNWPLARKLFLGGAAGGAVGGLFPLLVSMGSPETNRILTIVLPYLAFSLILIEIRTIGILSSNRLGCKVQALIRNFSLDNSGLTAKDDKTLLNEAGHAEVFCNAGLLALAGFFPLLLGHPESYRTLVFLGFFFYFLLALSILEIRKISILTEIRMGKSLELLSKHFNLDLHAIALKEVEPFLKAGRKAEAITLYHQYTGVAFSEAKAAIEKATVPQ